MAHTRPEFITPQTEFGILASILGIEREDILIPVHNSVLLRGGQRIFNVHSSRDCAGEHCPIHNVSDHLMRSWAQNFRYDHGFMERICPEHGVGHPDPDDPFADPRHGCCGCCSYDKYSLMA